MSLHTKNALILGVFLAAAAPFGGSALAGVSIGGVIQVVNLRGLERSVSGMLRGAGSGGVALQALLGLRLLLLLGLVGVVLVTLPVPPIAFVAGLSSVVPAVLWHGLARVEREV